MDIILVHGAYHNEKCWEKLKPYIEKLGHKVHTITLSGHNFVSEKNISKSGYKINIKEHAKEICNCAENIGRSCVLLGHSMGGLGIYNV